MTGTRRERRARKRLAERATRRAIRRAKRMGQGLAKARELMPGELRKLMMQQVRQQAPIPPGPKEHE